MEAIPELDFNDFAHGDGKTKQSFVDGLKDALSHIGFFALKNHGIPVQLIRDAYNQCDLFFDLPASQKLPFSQPSIHHQRGYTPFGTEHAKDQIAPDLKEFWQTGLPTTDGVESTFPSNIWPDDVVPEFKHVIDDLYGQMLHLSVELLKACSLALGKDEHWLPNMTHMGNTIMRLIHYPPLGHDVPQGAVRSAAHEDINFITLLVTATADGLEVMDHDGSWIQVQGNEEYIIVDTGDMIQNMTNGFFRSTTHRVVNPQDSSTRRYSMPMFVHPRNEIDLTPLPEFIGLTGGVVQYPSITAGEFLYQRLKEIGLAS
ncbi:MAG: isopenicillin N synthase family oxygenase [archaeon]|nr:isopenicillin N synthase family oxygenase [archaeon]MDA0842420.1 isopenicillin N synthase family oxygenase [archaeon]MDA1168608.1 isopenicillin N synthase family oxygenase [archaeon]